MSSNNVFATPQSVASIDDCFFYHTMQVPGYGVRPGQWDLRNTIDDYLGQMNFKNKRVLDVGTADGFISFHVEKQGAESIGYDLSEQDAWDTIPFAQYDYKQSVLASKALIKKLNNAFWFSHHALDSKAKMVYGTVYTIPREIGPVDVSIFGSILLHVRDPFAALQSALAITTETVVVAELLRGDWLSYVLRRLGLPHMHFLPDFNKIEPKDTWWYLSPAAIIRMVGALGFEDTRIHYHTQQYGAWGNYARMPYYTVIARRTKGSAIV
jgi:hypothetical protein